MGLRTWIIEYVDAWLDRVRKNNAILPDNVGLSGEIGQYMDGKWWGGYYGWRWPHGLFNQLESTVIGASNALLVSGDARFLELPRSVLRLVQRQAKRREDRVVVPHRHGDDGWYDYQKLNPKFPTHLWYVSREEEDWKRLAALTEPNEWETLRYVKGKGDSENNTAWLGFLHGRNPRYPLQILQGAWGETVRRMDLIRRDRTKPDEQDVHHWQRLNPVVLEGLVQLMLGAPNHIYHGGLLHCSVRYFDPEQQRPGVPPDVAALVDRITADGISLVLVNLSPSEKREVILQAGAFGEHRFTRVRQEMQPHQFHSVEGKHLRVRLGPSGIGRLDLGLTRFANRPTYAFPWHGDTIPVR